MIIPPDCLTPIPENIIVNCPVIAFVNDAPVAPMIPDPGTNFSPFASEGQG